MVDELRIALITLGDPNRLSGGYLYHRRLAELAPVFDAKLTFASFPERPFPLAMFDASNVLGQACRTNAQAFVLDSIAAAFVGPKLAFRRPTAPIAAMLHQPPGGIDYGPVRTSVQAFLDKVAYRRVERLLVTSDALAEDMIARGFSRENIHVVPPGRDVMIEEEVVAQQDIRLGRRAAFLCIANWIERKDILSLLEAFARLPDNVATLHLAGDDRVDPRYTARVRKRLSIPDLQGRVVYHGRLSLSK